LVADESAHGKLIRGLRRRQPEVDLIRIQDTPLAGADDTAVLEWAAQQGRIVITPDVSTLVAAAYERVRQGKAMPGVFVVRASALTGQTIESLEILATCSHPGEWEGQVIYLPL
jgi:hypothetical protein